MDPYLQNLNSKEAHTTVPLQYCQYLMHEHSHITQAERAMDSRTNANFDQFRFLGNDHLPLAKVNINTYFSLRAKCWLEGGVVGPFPRNLNK